MFNDDPLIGRVLAFARGQSRQVWAVGGFVRDRLLGRPNHDLDLIVPAGGIDLARQVARAFGGAFFVLDAERDVARAILHTGTGDELWVDVARLRAGTLAEDLALRDFTINAMAAEPAGDGSLQVIDLFGGQDDLANRIVRVVAEGTFRDDPLRTLRGVRQAAELGLTIEPGTADLMRRDAGLLARVAAERIRDELLRIVNAAGGWRHLARLAQLGLLAVALPDVQALVGMEQSWPHYLDVFDHTRAVMAHAEGLLALLWPAGPYAIPQAAAGDPVVIASPRRWQITAEMLEPFAEDLRAALVVPLAAGHTRRDWLLWACMAHDCGKPLTQSEETGGRLHFYNHERVGAELTAERLRRLAVSADEAQYVATLVEQHMAPAALGRVFPPSRRAIYRFCRAAGEYGPDAVLVSLADKLASRAPEPDDDLLDNLLATAPLIFAAYFRERSTQIDPPTLLDGREIMAETGLRPGPAVGRLVEALREAQAVGEVTTRDQARMWLREQQIS